MASGRNGTARKVEFASDWDVKEGVNLQYESLRRTSSYDGNGDNIWTR